MYHVNITYIFIHLFFKARFNLEMDKRRLKAGLEKAKCARHKGVGLELSLTFKNLKMSRWIANRLNDAGFLEDGLMMDKLPLLVIQLNTVFVVNDYRSF